MAITELKAFTFDRYLYFGQLAEKYLAAARGACATYLIHRILYKEKIPWWEWIEHVVDVGNPVEVTSKVHEQVSTERLLGAWGVGVRPEVAATVGLGAAIVAAASAEQRGRSGSVPSTATAAARKLFPTVLDHALGELERQLARGSETQRKLEKAIIAQQRSNLDDKPTSPRS